MCKYQFWINVKIFDQCECSRSFFNSITINDNVLFFDFFVSISCFEKNDQRGSTFINEHKQEFTWVLHVFHPKDFSIAKKVAVAERWASAELSKHVIIMSLKVETPPIGNQLETVLMDEKRFNTSNPKQKGKHIRISISRKDKWWIEYELVFFWTSNDLEFWLKCRINKAKNDTFGMFLFWNSWQHCMELYFKTLAASFGTIWSTLLWSVKRETWNSIGLYYVVK